jgi:hypothetical protein
MKNKKFIRLFSFITPVILLLVFNTDLYSFDYSRKGMRIDRKKGHVYISRIFKFDKKNFPRGKTDIIPFVLPYIKNGKDAEYLKKGEYSLRFLPYNWKLNGNL